MDSNPLTCNELREQYFADSARSESFDRHAAACRSCAAWLERQSVVRGVLGTMDRLVAPAVLGRCVDEDLQLGAGCLVGVLRSLERQDVPVQLEQRLAETLAAPGGQASVLEELLGSVEAHPAPKVLDRLVDEELSSPAASVARRFAGGLFRMSPPKSLQARVSGDLSAPETAVLRRRWLSLGSAAAAAAFLVFTLAPLFHNGATKVPRPFRVVEVESLASLDPLARSLVDGLAGGNVQAMDRRKESNGGGL